MVLSVDARSGAAVSEVAAETTSRELDEICGRALEVFGQLDRLGRVGRAQVLDAMADELEARGDSIVQVADRESALGVARLRGELARTCYQLRFFGEVLRDGAYLEAAIDHASPTPMGPRPDLRRMLRPLGPVAVFGAGNFPLAFSVPGGDTASALAAGCPVVVKVHEGHPATSVLCEQALAAGARRGGLVSPVVFLVFGQQAGRALVEHPVIRAVGFTGSQKAGRYLRDLAVNRPSPVPFYGELGALNPLVVCPGAAAERPEEIVAGLVASFTLGVGQFCTKPGLAFLPEGQAGDELRDKLAAAVGAVEAGEMLAERVARAYVEGTAQLRHMAGVRILAEGRGPKRELGFWGVPLLLEADRAALGGALQEECFGPVLVVARYRSVAELGAALGRLSPALVAAVHASEADAELVRPLVDQLGQLVGRIVWNGYPTGLAVAWATHHGGPYPATTDPLHTSVGAAAIRRWLRPLAFQDVPDHLLPPELQAAPPAEHAVPRRVDGRLVV